MISEVIFLKELHPQIIGDFNSGDTANISDLYIIQLYWNNPTSDTSMHLATRAGFDDKARRHGLILGLE